jgi:hypothetical protein
MLAVLLAAAGFVCARQHVGQPPPTPSQEEKVPVPPEAANPGTYEVQIDELPPASIAGGDQEIGPLDTGRKHLLKIRFDGKTVDSWWFRFDKGTYLALETLGVTDSFGFRPWIRGRCGPKGTHQPRPPRRRARPRFELLPNF